MPTHAYGSPEREPLTPGTVRWFSILDGPNGLRVVAVEADPRESTAIRAEVRRDRALGRLPVWFASALDARRECEARERALVVASHNCPHGRDCPGPECCWQD